MHLPMLCILLAGLMFGACNEDNGGGGGSSTAVFREESRITSSAPMIATTDLLYSYTIEATGSPYPTLTVTGAPAWLTLDDGVLSGTPTVADEGSFGPITITASNGVGAADTQEFMLEVVAAAAPLFTSTAVQVAVEGEPYSYTPVVTGAPAPTISVSAMPAWMRFDGATLWGTPGTADVGTNSQVVLTARNSVGQQVAQLFNVEVQPLMGMPSTLPFDFNGDGANDVIVGAYRNPLNGTSSGRAYIFFGGSSLSGDFSAAEADVIVTGEGAGSWLGFSVGSAGDFNGDGYSDLLVGSPGHGSDAGRVYLVYGSAQPLRNVYAANADLIFDGELPGDLLGTAVSTAGDVNGDGYGDMLLGAGEADVNGIRAGKAYLMLGRPSWSGEYSVSVADVTFEGVLNGENVGTSLSSMGDMNGDGFDEILLGGDQSATAGSGVGRGYLFLGGPSLYGNIRIRTELADAIIVGTTGGDRLGISLASGDVNGDGMNDFMIGASGHDPGGRSAAGAVFIFFGRTNLGGQEIISINDADVVIEGEVAGDALGVCIAVIGDIDGDGAEDMLLGASGNDQGGFDAGRAYVIAGDAGMSGVMNVSAAQASFFGEDPLFRLGSALASAGDINGDGLADLLIGAYRHDDIQPLFGRAYVFHGSGALTGNVNAGMAEVKITSQSARDYLGFAVSGGR